jgi:eukaryotic-like serine/threonine-protein kinase
MSQVPPDDDDAQTILPTVRTDATGAANLPTGFVLAPGRKLGSRYTIIKLLGRGGMGAVYQAWDDELQVAVAIKTILPDADADEHATHAAEERFKRELLLARKVSHKNVVRIHDLGEVDGQKYITMTYVDGETLGRLIRRDGPLPVPKAVAFAKQIADGLAAAHEVGIVHRDLKPENVMITPEGQALIMDFGIARGAAGTTETQAGTIIGTLEYMAPEQASGLPVDHRADIYAFGLIAYDMLLGRQRAKGRDNAMTELVQRAQRAPAPPTTTRADVPAAFEQIVMKCVQPEKKARPQTTPELVEMLARLAPDGHLRPEPRRLTRRMTVGLAFGALLFVAAVVGGAWYINRPPPPQRAPISVLIANFSNTTGEPLFDGVIEQALGVGIEGAGFINAYPRRDALRVLATQVPGGALSEENATLVAVREAIPVVLAGGIAANGGGYRLSVKALQAGTPVRILFERTVDAANKDDVFPAVGRIAAQVRRELGDQDVDVNRIKVEETFTANSLESAREYMQGQELLAAGNYAAAIERYQAAIKLDPDFGRAYSGMGAAAVNAGFRDDADRYIQEALARSTRMSEREKLRTRGLYYAVGGDTQRAREQYEPLIEKYPADFNGLANLAIVYFQTRDFAKAIEIGRRAAVLTPRAAVRQNNIALFALYASDFRFASEHARKVLELNPDFVRAHYVIAMAHATQGEYDQAAERYRELAKRPGGATVAALGLADLALLRGRTAEASGILEAAIKVETAASPRGRLMRVLLDAYLAQGRIAEAVRTAEITLKGQPEMGTSFTAGRVFIAAKQLPRALAIGKTLAEKLDAESQSVGRVLQAETALAAGQPNEALALLDAARKLADGWLVRYTMGRAYLARNAFAEADSEFDACLQRRGEATAVFLDDIPSYRGLAPVYYYQGLARTGLRSAGAAESFKTFVAFKDGGDETSPPLTDARARLR